VETEAFLNHLFKHRLDSDREGLQSTAAGLLAELATDPFVFLTAESRRKCRQGIWRWVLRQKLRRLAFYPVRSNVIRALLRESQGHIQKAWKSASRGKQELADVLVLDLWACSDLVDVAPLRVLQNIEHLSLRDCRKVSDLRPLGDLKSLQVLDLHGCAATASIQRCARKARQT
jgi:hypothetical protein